MASSPHPALAGGSPAKMTRPKHHSVLRSTHPRSSVFWLLSGNLLSFQYRVPLNLSSLLLGGSQITSPGRREEGVTRAPLLRGRRRHGQRQRPGARGPTHILPGGLRTDSTSGPSDPTWGLQATEISTGHSGSDRSIVCSKRWEPTGWSGKGWMNCDTSMLRNVTQLV